MASFRPSLVHASRAGEQFLEQCRQANELKMHSLLNLLPAGVYVCDGEGRITFFNSRAAELWGRKPKLNDNQEKICPVHRCWLDGKLVPPDKTPMAVAVREGKAFHNLEATIERADGTMSSVLVNIDPLLDEDGKPCGAISVFQDVTEQKQNDVAAQRLAAIIESSDDAIISKDLKGIISSWNKGAERIFGYRSDEVIGKPITILIPEIRLDEEPGILDRIRNGQRIDHYETVRRRKDGKLLNLSITISPIKGPNGQVIGASKVARDITDKVRATEELEQTVAERTASLREAIAQMEEFSYTVSHDLRSPIRAVHGYAQALLEDYGQQLDKAGKEYLDRILQSSLRMQRLIHDVLTYSRVSRVEMRVERVSLQALLHGIVQQYGELAASEADIFLEAHLPPVLAHEPSLGQALANLLSNAVKFVAPGVRPIIHVTSERKDGQVLIRFQDNGIGVKPEHQHRLFGMFERIHPDEEYEGTGIGLAIVRKALERMGGKVGIESDGFHGSTFWIQLPEAKSS